MNIIKNERWGFLCLITAIGLWSTVEVVIRTLHGAIAPIQFAWVRFLLGGVFLMLFLPLELRRRGLRLNASILRFAALVSLPGIAVSAVALQYGLTLAGAAVVATVYGAAPLIAMGMSRVLLGDTLTVPRVAGLLVGFLGILLLTLGKPSPTFSLAGVLCTLLSASAFCLWSVLVKKYAGPYSGLPITALSFFFGVLFLTPLVLWEGGGLHLEPLWANAMAVIYLAVGTTGIAYGLYFVGLQHVDPTRAMSVILLKPPVVAFLAIVFLGESLTWNVLVAMVLILAALYGVLIRDRRVPLRLSHGEEKVAQCDAITKEEVPCPKPKTA